MKKITLSILVSLFALVQQGVCQRVKSVQYVGEAIMTDSSSTLFIPIRYHEDFLSSNKLMFGNDYYANFLVYNFTTDSYKKLFETDTFIEAFKGNTSFHLFGSTDSKQRNITHDWVFLFVKSTDHNGNGKVDENDPSVLYMTTVKGENLKRITEETENVVSVQLFEEEGFALIRFQRDVNADKLFKREDREFYFRKISLTDLTLGKKISID